MALQAIYLSFKDEGTNKTINGIYGPNIASMDHAYSVAKEYLKGFADEKFEAKIAIVSSENTKDFTVAPILEGFGPYHRTSMLSDEDLKAMKEVIPVISMAEARKLVDRKQLAGTALCRNV